MKYNTFLGILIMSLAVLALPVKAVQHYYPADGGGYSGSDSSSSSESSSNSNNEGSFSSHALRVLNDVARGMKTGAAAGAVQGAVAGAVGEVISGCSKGGCHKKKEKEAVKPRAKERKPRYEEPELRHEELHGH